MKPEQISKFIGRKVKITYNYKADKSKKSFKTIFGVIEKVESGWCKIYSDYKYNFLNAEYIRKIKIIY